MLMLFGISCGNEAGTEVVKSVSSDYNMTGYCYMDVDEDGVYNNDDYPIRNVWIAVVDTQSSYWNVIRPDGHGAYAEAYTDDDGYYSIVVTNNAWFGVVSYLRPLVSPVTDYHWNPGFVQLLGPQPVQQDFGLQEN